MFGQQQLGAKGRPASSDLQRTLVTTWRKRGFPAKLDAFHQPLTRLLGCGRRGHMRLARGVRSNRPGGSFWRGWHAQKMKIKSIQTRREVSQDLLTGRLRSFLLAPHRRLTRVPGSQDTDVPKALVVATCVYFAPWQRQETSRCDAMMLAEAILFLSGKINVPVEDHRRRLLFQHIREHTPWNHHGSG